MTTIYFSKRFPISLIVITLALSFLVLIGWLFEYKFILKYLAGNSKMKFDIALFFFLTSLVLLDLWQQILHKYIIYSILFIIVAYNVATLLEHFFTFSSSSTLGLLVFFEKYHHLYPGRMSIGAALGFLGLATGIMLLKKSAKKYIIIAQHLFAIIISLSLITIIPYLLNIPSENKPTFIDTMAISTALLFLIQSLIGTLKNKHVGFFSIFHSNLMGSRLLKELVPVIVLIPIFLSFILLQSLNHSIIQTDFGIVIYTVILIITTIFCTTYISKNLNEADNQKNNLRLELNKSNAFLTQLKDAIDKVNLMMIMDVNGYIIYVNKKFCEVSQYEESELIGTKISDLRADYHPDSFFDEIWNVISKGKIWQGEIKNITKLGAYFWLDTVIIPFNGKNDMPAGHLVLNTEINAKKAAENLANQLTNRLIEKNKDLEHFVYIASHDLQEPLLTISCISEMLNVEYRNQLDENGQSYLDYILGSVSRMQFLVKDLMNHSRLGTEFEFTSINTNKIIDQIKSDLAKKIEETMATIIVEDLPHVFGNEVTIRQLFQNLISNSIKFSRKEVNPVITISGYETKTNWQFSVADNGIGIKEKDRTNIFKIFKRLHRNSVYEGTGIGLANCKKITELHNGKIWVNSNESDGCTFVFTITKKLNNENSKISNVN